MNHYVEDVVEPPRQGAWMALASGILAAVGFLTGTALYLLDDLDVIADPPRYQSGGEDVEAQLAGNMVSYLERQHDVWWNIAVRDSLLPLAFLALIVLVTLAADRVRWRHPAAVMVACFLVGGVLNIVSNLVYLGQLRYWRHTGWSAEPPGPVIAVGTASDAVVAATTYLEAASYLVLALGAVGLGWLTLHERHCLVGSARSPTRRRSGWCCSPPGSLSKPIAYSKQQAHSPAWCWVQLSR
jgi:hypothetical protein